MVTSQVCDTVQHWLDVSLAQFAGDVQLVLLFGAHNAHMVPPLWTACVATGAWLALVLAMLAWLLQPLDTRAF